MSVTISKTNKPLNPRAKDLSPKGYNRASLYSGKALDFDGVNDYVDCGTLDITDYTEISIATYFNTDSTATTQIAFSLEHTAGEDIRFGVSAGEIFCAVDDGTLYQITEPVSSDKWYFVVWTFDGSNLKGYINGIEFDSISASFNFSTAAGTLNIGRRVGGSLYYNGELANTKIFNTALTAGEVSDLYNNPEKIVPDGVADSALKLWLPMMEGAGIIAYDGSGNENHGTISGATWTSGIGAPVAQTALVGWNKAENHVVTNSEMLNAYFSRQNVVVSYDEAVSPSGETDAIKVVASNSNIFHFVSQEMSASADVKTQSIYAKANEYEHIYMVIRVDGGTNRYGVKFDLTNGTFVDDITLGSPTQTDYSITSVGNGWYRVSISCYHTSGNVIAVFGPSLGGTLTSINNDFQGDGVSSIFVYGFQVEDGTAVGPYVPTVSTTRVYDKLLLPQGLTANKDITNVNAVSRNAYALNLDGASWAEVHDNASLDFGTGDFTLECWVVANFVNTGSGYNGILNTGGEAAPIANAGAYIGSTSSALLAGCGTASFSFGSYVAGDWYHLIFTREGGTVKTYTNGAFVNSYLDTTNVTKPQDAMVGNDNLLLYRTYKDQVALPRIYNRALTATEVARNYNADKSKFGL